MKKKPTAKRKTRRPPIERQETIKEVQTKSFEVVRLSRVKYVGNDHVFIDVRFFRRGYDNEGEETLYPTTKGVQMREDLFLKLVNVTVLLGLKRRLRDR